METNTQTVQQIERFLKKVSQKFPHTSEPTLLTDIHVRVTQESGDLMAFDDDDNEITRCVVEEWIGNNADDFYADITAVLRKVIAANNDNSLTWFEIVFLIFYCFQSLFSLQEIRN